MFSIARIFRIVCCLPSLPRFCLSLTRAMVVLGLVVPLSAPPALAQTTLNLTANEKAVEQAVASLLIKDIYAKAGLNATVEPLPGKRATQLALDGGKDGEVARIKPYAEKYPRLLRVDPAYYSLTTGVFAKKGRKLMIASKADLVNFRVGVVRGIAHAERAVEGSKDLIVVDKYEQLYRMIDAGRIDVGVDTGINGLAEISALGLQHSIEQIGDIAGYDLHNILHPKHASLVPKISATIKAMQASGEIPQLIRKYEKQVIDGWVSKH